ncbi:hypothetical protein GCM10010981_13880 [Dyella nitratireducens]|uniref:Uncharacterized protein n=1 Tax=Dyella nitratireducens TaxID=1849580 RepID=A0ABQ1FQS1_9GAMM|nr:hypothetical protein GCM10010981_13880 [Dyella nitratireducens]GLQ43548.1 hypothetical protein GCM10007902_33980 [Dyella nitratireducens]
MQTQLIQQSPVDTRCSADIRGRSGETYVAATNPDIIEVDVRVVDAWEYGVAMFEAGQVCGVLSSTGQETAVEVGITATGASISAAGSGGRSGRNICPIAKCGGNSRAEQNLATHTMFRHMKCAPRMHHGETLPLKEAVAP